jgi:hypothetical protein
MVLSSVRAPLGGALRAGRVVTGPAVLARVAAALLTVAPVLAVFLTSLVRWYLVSPPQPG